MFKRIVGARNISVEDIPTYMDEFDELEEYYFSKTEGPERPEGREAEGPLRVHGAHEGARSPRSPRPIQAGGRPGCDGSRRSLLEFVTKRLVANGAIQAATPDLAQRIEWAARWAKDTKYSGLAQVDSGEGTGVVPPLVIDPRTAMAVGEFARGLASAKSAEEIQGLAFEAVRKTGAKSSDFFSVVYRILLGSERGPRLGPYIMDAHPEAVARKLREAIEPKL